MSIQVGLAQIEIEAGQPRKNLAKMLDYISKAKKMQLDILIFPELCLSGYLLGDLWEYEYFLRECENCGQDIIKASQDICLIFGNIAVDWQKSGENGLVRKYNACFVAQEQKLIQGNLPYPFYIKTVLPDYGQFEDSRHFYSNAHLSFELNCSLAELIQPLTVEIRGQQLKLGCMICEDGWSTFHTIKVPQILASHQPDILINISSSPYFQGKNQLRKELFTHLAQEAKLPVVYINHVGMQNNGKNIYAYDGASKLFDQQGKQVSASPSLKEDLLCFTYLPANKLISTKTKAEAQKSAKKEDRYQTLIYATNKFLQQNKINKAVVGVSGGIDSAVCAAFLAYLLGSKNILLINMPGPYNSATTKNLAQQLAQNLRTNYAVVPIEESMKLTQKQIQQIDFNGSPLNVSEFTLENIQARDRSARLLAAAAAALGGVFTCNANKSEITVGYGTFYGDLAGAFAPLADLWKHQVYSFGLYLNEQIFQAGIIPAEIFQIRPSAELSASQTVGSGGDPLYYPYHDYLFKAFVESKLSPLEISQYYFENKLEEKIGCPAGLSQKLFAGPAEFFADLEKWWLLLNNLSVAKRIQSPPIITLSSQAFGFERRESQLNLALPTDYLDLKISLIKK